MNKNTIPDNLRRLLEKIGQEHILHFFDELSEGQKKNLIDQISKLELDKIPLWVEKYIKNEAPVAIPDHFEPAPSYPAAPKTPAMAQKYARAKKRGEDLVRQGRVAGFVVAGGQGTRLGYDGPKGNYPISPVKNKTLFQIFAETLRAASKKYGITIPFYIMTSPLNYAATVDIFESADWYGLSPDNVFIFQQGTLPNFSFDGKILLAAKDQIAASPDGHGGSLKALYASGAVADMKQRGVEYISYWQVDNPLVKLIDPLFIGLHDLDKAEMSSKALVKAGPLEKVGNFCLVDGKVTVIEYSDLPDEQALRRNPDGTLVFELGSIGIHIINRSFIEKLNAGGNFALPFHRAVKKIPHIDGNGTLIQPDKPNGIKLETFVFDALPMAERSIILQTRREEEFAPVKNASGTDSPEVTRRMMIERAANWLQHAGVKVPRKPDGSPDCVLEIAPSFALEPEDIAAKRGGTPPITAGSEIYLE
ncbi:MAG TPA: UDPGP type 1 family protein [Anaerohalosphaeraceae bacterium]|nr:UDPGP type 1 family protein [Anaerohalosphaeraceae bacterium]HOL32397.1 UDPGP type 1 family protein [Anaerohalosphaeraceae bacterium]HOM76199.1 UDPGP type 1 family protein [Anaerohalosphaeraceae bacterium]HPC64055.1 UDPGP type 1 family protein [Anaerohalosphaeraceae bacterium]HPO70519.1 UDPGP type 1 family protein [Anaerohalosphaeraceae bacterium]